jgi:hypothetical protein
MLGLGQNTRFEQYSGRPATQSGLRVSSSDAVDGSSTGTEVPWMWELLRPRYRKVGQTHGIDAAGNVIVRRQLKRRYVLPFFLKIPPCLVGIEACAEMGVILGPAPRDCTPVYATRL